MRAVIDASNPGTGVASSERDEVPRQLPFNVSHELQHERECTLRGRAIAQREVKLCAAGKFGLVDPLGIARQERRESHAGAFEFGSRVQRALKRLAREAADSVAPDRLVKAHRQPVRRSPLGHVTLRRREDSCVR